jgi:hypothetical protein
MMRGVGQRTEHIGPSMDGACGAREKLDISAKRSGAAGSLLSCHRDVRRSVTDSLPIISLVAKMEVPTAQLASRSIKPSSMQ